MGRSRSRSRSPARRVDRSPERRRRSRSPPRRRSRSPDRRWRDGARRDDWRSDRRDDWRGDDRRAPDRSGPPPPGPPPPPPPPPPPQAPAGPRVGQEPRSLDELLKARAAAAASAAKPVFMTKAARQAAAEAEAAAAAAAAAERERQLAELARQSAREAEERRRGEEPVRRGAVDTQQRELEEIKQAYLGKPKEKKKLTKAADKFKFMFDWEPDQDTSRGVGPVAPGAHGAPALLFGRGMLAGVDRSVQRLEQPKSAGASVAARREERFERPAERPTRQAASSWRDKPLGEMTEREWRLFREEHNIAFKGGRLPLPFRTWEESSLPEQLVKAVQRVGYAQPSPIQMAAIPIGLSGRDVIGVAQTGSGKTCAFVLPMLAYIMRLPPMRGNEELESRGPYSLILSPTRELAQQIEEETVKFAHFLDYRCVSLVGGQDIEQQGFKLRQGCEVLIGTPGRVDDCLQRRYTVLLQCNFVVLDEADRMIDYGFEPQVVKVLDAMPSSNLKPVDLEEGAELTGGAKVYRTTFMFSATMPTAVERLARTYMRQPAVVTIGAAGKAASEIQQVVVLLRSPDEKAAQLEKWLARHAETQVIVFVNSHKVCDFVAKALERLGKSISILHGGKTQDAREAAIDAFRNKRTSILLATDVAGRGIDVPDVGLVVNYQLPATIEAYTHRIGRTGRAGRKGVAVSLATNDDAGLFFDLRNFLQDSGNVVPPELAAHQASRKKSDKGGDKFGRNIEM